MNTDIPGTLVLSNQTWLLSGQAWLIVSVEKNMITWFVVNNKGNAKCLSTGIETFQLAHDEIVITV
jgi:hypothetical protein